MLLLQFANYTIMTTHFEIQYYSAGQTSAFFLILDTNLPGTKTH